MLKNELIHEWLLKEHRKHSYLQEYLRVSDSLVALMLSDKAHVPKKRTLKKLAKLLGVQESDLLMPREAA